jgi:hypothetical protein
MQHHATGGRSSMLRFLIVDSGRYSSICGYCRVQARSFTIIRWGFPVFFTAMVILVWYARKLRGTNPETSTREHVIGQGKPKGIKGVYVSSYVASDPTRFKELVRLTEETEINAWVIDVKDVTGEVTYETDVPLAQKIGASTNRIPDLKAMVRGLKEEGIYTIARVATFQDNILPRERPNLAVVDSTTRGPWSDHRGLAWSNPHKRRVWVYNVAIAKEAAEAGFDEIQFDYVRFPSDGPIAQATYPGAMRSRQDTIAEFLRYAHEELKPMDVYVAADVFGLTGRNDRNRLGQVVGKMVPHLDVLCPMIYPSHYAEGAYGYPNPNAEPYALIKKALADFRAKISSVCSDVELRPWLQDFDRGVPEYGPLEVRAQIQATYDSGEIGWMLWNPYNRYTKDALKG